MKVRKLAVALALVGGLGSGLAHALGLGEVELQSYLNEPLDADISLRNTEQVKAGDVYVKLAPPEVFKRVGVDRNFFLTNLKFEVRTSPDGQLVVNITSRQAVREPYLDFLIEVTWPSGKLLREYSLLLDPPAYAEQDNSQQTVRPAQTSSSAGSSERSDSASSSTARDNRSDSSASSNNQSDSKQGSRQDTFGPTSASDTLWTIALKVRPDAGYSPQQVMLALQALNPQAFMDGNINRLKRGEVLRLPTAEQVARLSSSQAVREVTAQNKALKKSSAPVDATEQQTADSASPEQPASGDELRLMAADDKAASAVEGASAGGENGVAGGSKNAGNTVATMEELDKSERENDELNSRVGDLESQVETLQRLIELKNSQLAQMQQKAGSEAGAASQENTATGNADETAMADGSASDKKSDKQAGEQSGEMASDTGKAGEEPGEEGSQAGNDTSTADNMNQAPDTDAASASNAENAEDESSGDNTGSTDSDQVAPEDLDAMTAGNASQDDASGSSTENMTADTMNGEASGKNTDSADNNAMTGSEGMSGESENGESAQDQQQPDDMAAADGDETGSGTEDRIAPEDVGADQSASTAESQAEQQGNADQMAESQTDQSDQPEKDRGLMDKLIHGLKTNPVYQLVAGAAAVLLLLILGLLARRNANREKAFYDDLNRESDDDSESFDLNVGGDNGNDSSVDQSKGGDAIAEANAYLAYGRHDQAAEVLEDGISQEPSRSDLRIKLLGVYADAGNRDAFEKQYRELETLDDESALAEAETLRDRLDESESTPSIDELESQLRSGAGDDNDYQTTDSDWNDSSLSSGFVDYRDDHEGGKDAPIEYDLSGVVLDKDGEPSADNTEPRGVSDELGSMDEITTDDDPALDLERDEDPIQLEGEDNTESELTEDDFGTLELDEDFLGDSPAEQAGGTSAEDSDRATADDEQPAINEDPELAIDEPALATDEDGKLDESFLDDLDAELDKVAGEESEETTTLDDDNLEELELDVSDEDLALMEEVAEKPEADQPESIGADTADDDEALVPEDSSDSLEDSLDLQDESTLTSTETDADPEADPEERGSASEQEQEPETLRPETTPPGFTVEDFDEEVLDDEDDFDFLAGTDEAATKLDLARAYVEMGDAEGARDILEEVAIEGDEDQKSEAQQMLKNLS